MSETHETLIERLRELEQQARKNHGADCRAFAWMAPSLASHNCANCGRSTTAHVVTMLCDALDELLAARAAAEALAASPVQTCETCRFRVAADRNCQIVMFAAGVETQLQIERNERAVPRPGDPRFGCTLHQPVVPSPTTQEPTR